MQTAAQSKNRLISPDDAVKGKDYSCPECTGALRLRKGGQRQPHFYHTKPSKGCRLAAKSFEHLALQEHIAHLLQGEGAALEHPFPDIGRIADVACLTTKKILEVQCSPITLSEAKARCADYESIGYTVIWILHERSFNKKRISPAEKFLRSRGAYYTNFSLKREGVIYDQLASHRSSVDLKSFQPLKSPGAFCHAGDWHHRRLQGEKLPSVSPKPKSFFKKLICGYDYLLTRLLT